MPPIADHDRPASHRPDHGRRDPHPTPGADRRRARRGHRACCRRSRPSCQHSGKPAARCDRCPPGRDRRPLSKPAGRSTGLRAEGLLAAKTRSGLVETIHDGAVAVVSARRGLLVALRVTSTGRSSFGQPPSRFRLRLAQEHGRCPPAGRDGDRHRVPTTVIRCTWPWSSRCWPASGLGETRSAVSTELAAVGRSRDPFPCGERESSRAAPHLAQLLGQACGMAPGVPESRVGQSRGISHPITPYRFSSPI